MNREPVPAPAPRATLQLIVDNPNPERARPRAPRLTELDRELERFRARFALAEQVREYAAQVALLADHIHASTAISQLRLGLSRDWEIYRDNPKRMAEFVRYFLAEVERRDQINAELSLSEELAQNIERDAAQHAAANAPPTPE